MPAQRDDDASRLSTPKSGAEPGVTRVDNQQADLKREPSAQKAGSDAGRAGAVDDVGATEAAFHKAIGLDKVPLKGTVEFTVKRVDMEAQRAEGGARAQHVRFSNARGENLSGLQYTTQEGTFLKTAAGQKFSVSAEPTGGYVLTAADLRFEAVKLTVLPDFFRASADTQTLSERPVKITEVARKEGQSASNLAASLAQDMLTVKDSVVAQSPTVMGQEGPVLKEVRSSKITPQEEKFDQSKQSADPALVAATDNQAAALAGRAASSLDIISSAIADLTAASNPALKGPEPKTEATVATPPAQPITFDLADIVEPVVSPDRPVPAGDVKDEESDKAGVVPVGETSVPAVEDALPEDEAVRLAEMDDVVEAQQIINKAKAERRRRYVVKDKDTLSSIAAKQLRDRRLSELIFEINKHVIPIKVIRGRPVRQLKPRMIIYLPTTAEIEEYRGRLGSATVESMDDDQLGEDNEFVNEAIADLGATAVGEAGATKGKSSATAPNRQSYTVRLGDTLKSVAMKHPALSEVGLWLLLAEVNGLSTEVDERGQPVTRLMRGNQLIIPAPEEIEQFRISRKQVK